MRRFSTRPTAILLKSLQFSGTASAVVACAFGAVAPLHAALGSPTLPHPSEPYQGKVGKVLSESQQAWPRPVHAPAGAPNVLLIMTDDVGFAASSVFGGLVPTPNLERLAKSGLRYNRFHTTGICSPTRASLLTGRNPHAVATGNIVDVATGFPGYLSEIPKSAASVAEVLRQNGYNTSFFGKHHNVPSWQRSAAGPFDQWPTGQGFEYFFGFMGGDVDQWHPRLYRGTTLVDDNPVPEGQTLDHALADDAIRWLRSQHAADPAKPYLLYLAPGTMHAPHQVPREWIDRFRGRFDQGWDRAREQIFARQKRADIVPRNAKLTPRPLELPAWSSLTAEERRVHARMMEVAAATLGYQDAQIGRVLDEIERQGERENTLVIFIQGDNGASGEAGPAGTSNEIGKIANGIEDDAKSLISMIDEMGGPRTYQNYSAAWAWAMNTPFQWMKQIGSHLGGIRNGMVLSWPGRVSGGGAMRSQFSHVNDIAPTIFEAAGAPIPAIVNGVAQQPLDGVSLLYTLDKHNSAEKHTTQYFEITANRAIYHEGWFANTKPRRMPWQGLAAPGRADTDYEWELYDLRSDFSQSVDLAGRNPAKLAELKQIFDEQATKNNVYPLDDRFTGARGGDSVLARGQKRTQFTYLSKDESVAVAAAPSFAGRPFHLTAEVSMTEADQTGVLVANGSWFGGWSFYLKNSRPVVMQALSQRQGEQYVVAAREPLPVGPVKIEYLFSPDRPGLRSGGTMRILVNGRQVAEGQIPRTIAVTAGIGETFDIGRDTGVPVSTDYKGQGAFAGQIKQITVSLDEPKH